MTETTRRNFLIAGAAAATPFFIKGDDKTGKKNPILGSGEFQFECIHDWAMENLPSTIKYGNTHSVCEDQHGNIYVHHTVHKTSQSWDSVVVFDAKGKFVKSWGPMFHGGAHGMHIRKEGNTEYAYFCDEKHGIITKRTLKGEEVWTMGYPQDSPIYQKGPGSTGPGGANGLNYRPTNFAIVDTAPGMSEFWVGDGYGSYYMFHYTQKGNEYPRLKNVFGGPAPMPAGGGGGGARGGGAPGGGGGGGGRGAGRGAGGGGGAAAGGPGPQAQNFAPPQGGGDGGARGGGGGARGGGGGGRAARPPAPIDQMNNPHGNMVDIRDPKNPILLVADRGHGRIVRYSIEDKPMDIIAGTTQPCHFHEFKGNIVVPDLAGPVHIFDKDNKLVVSMGGGKEGNPPRTTEDRSKFVPGQFVNPHGATWDHNGNIFVGEWVEIGRVTKLRRV